MHAENGERVARTKTRECASAFAISSPSSTHPLDSAAHRLARCCWAFCHFSIRAVDEVAISWCGEGSIWLHKNCPSINYVAWAVSERPDIFKSFFSRFKFSSNMLRNLEIIRSKAQLERHPPRTAAPSYDSRKNFPCSVVNVCKV